MDMEGTLIRKLFLYLICAVIVSFIAMAMNAPAGARELAASSALAVTGMAEAPIGYVQYCTDNPTECSSGNGRGRRVILTSGTWDELNSINLAVNGAVEPTTDLEIYGVLEYWTLPTGMGDCEDYVLLKRKALIEAGWPAEALLITVVRDEKNEGHAVLTVATDKGDYVLDNQRDDIRPWQTTGYSFVKRQSQFDVNRWVYVSNPDSVAGVASTN
jgi:predicted transglutaminase-like cysteine proteinase